MNEAAFSPYERYKKDASITPDSETQTTKSRVRAVDCPECEYWFLGCLRGRAVWHDKAIMPNRRHFTNGLNERAIRCDAFTWDHDEDRAGRCVVP